MSNILPGPFKRSMGGVGGRKGGGRRKRRGGNILTTLTTGATKFIFALAFYLP